MENSLHMHPHDQILEPWLSFLRELDSSVNEAVRLDCMGDLSLRRCTDFRAQLETLMSWKLRQPRPAKPCWP
jgi:hypothetical protein